MTSGKLLPGACAVTSDKGARRRGGIEPFSSQTATLPFFQTVELRDKASLVVNLLLSNPPPPPPPLIEGTCWSPGPPDEHEPENRTLYRWSRCYRRGEQSDFA
ncbi:unnamed protein product [Pleuronectes platessa]|uniref:Uncharacterized protein n=1 Tax=Pleuronectes platessa TaxID=8262 RepID=A0A9N7YP45_PLEPL|nr:unnamed protein product [Pleuronectes platessa]